MDLVLKIRDGVVGPGAAGVTGRCCSDFVEITMGRASKYVGTRSKQKVRGRNAKHSQQFTGIVSEID